MLEMLFVANSAFYKFFVIMPKPLELIQLAILAMKKNFFLLFMHAMFSSCNTANYSRILITLCHKSGAKLWYVLFE